MAAPVVPIALAAISVLSKLLAPKPSSLDVSQPAPVAPAPAPTGDETAAIPASGGVSNEQVASAIASILGIQQQPPQQLASASYRVPGRAMSEGPAPAAVAPAPEEEPALVAPKKPIQQGKARGSTEVPKVPASKAVVMPVMAIQSDQQAKEEEWDQAKQAGVEKSVDAQKLPPAPKYDVEQLPEDPAAKQRERDSYLLIRHAYAVRLQQMQADPAQKKNAQAYARALADMDARYGIKYGSE